MFCFKFGRSLEKAGPAVVVYVRLFPRTDWEVLEIGMKRILDLVVSRGYQLPSIEIYQSMVKYIAYIY